MSCPFFTNYPLLIQWGHQRFFSFFAWRLVQNILNIYSKLSAEHTACGYVSFSQSSFHLSLISFCYPPLVDSCCHGDGQPGWTWTVMIIMDQLVKKNKTKHNLCIYFLSSRDSIAAKVLGCIWFAANVTVSFETDEMHEGEKRKQAEVLNGVRHLREGGGWLWRTKSMRKRSTHGKTGSHNMFGGH